MLETRSHGQLVYYLIGYGQKVFEFEWFIVMLNVHL